MKVLCPECQRLQVPLEDGACPNCLLGLALTETVMESMDMRARPAPDTCGEGPGQRIGRYKLLEIVGEGGFGTVWMAQQEEPVRRRVALKILKAGMDTKQVVSRFEAERQALALMDHPNIARVFDGGTTETGRPYFVMELVRGVPITEFCDARKLGTSERIELLIPVCHAIQHAHQKGVIHRDLKPSNLLVTELDGKPAPKVLDFGIAKALESGLTEDTLFTRFNQFMGTPAYMSPEQAGLGGLDVDSRSDVYSLGVVLYELLTGKTPIDPRQLIAQGFEAVLKTIREAEPPKPSTRLSTLARAELSALAVRRSEDPERLNRLVRGELDWIVLKALEKDRSRRYETANALASDLNRFLENEPVAAAPPSLTYQLSKFGRKHRKTLVTAGAFVLLLLIGIVATSWLAVRATRLAKAEIKQRGEAEQARSQQRELLYASDMTVAFKAIEAGQAQRARRILEQHIPAVLETDLRSWDWRYLWDQSRPAELAVLANQPGFINSLARSADGRRLAVGVGRGNLRLFDLASRDLLAERRIGRGIIESVAFTPDDSGIYLTLHSTNFARVDSQTLDVQATFTGHQGRVSGLALAPSGQTLISVAGDSPAAPESQGETFVWDTAAREVRFKFPASRGAALRPQFSRTGRYLSRGFNEDGRVEIWDMRELKLAAKFKAHRNTVCTAVFSPDENLLATSGDDGFVRLWNWRQREEAGTLGMHAAAVADVAFSPDGLQLASCSLDSTIRIWDVPQFREHATLRGHEGRVQRVVFSKDGRQLISAGGPDSTLRVWNPLARGNGSLLDTSKESLTTGSFSPNGEHYGLLRTTADGSVLKLWRTRRPDQSEMELERSIDSPEIFSFALGPARLALLEAGSDRISILETATGRKLGEVSSPLPLLGPIAFSADGHWLAARAVSNHVIVASQLSRKTEAVFQLRHVGESEGVAFVGNLCFSPDASKLWVVFSGASRVDCVDWRARGYLHRLDGHAASITSMAISRDGTILATGSMDMTVRLWDTTSGAALTVLHGGGGGVYSVSFSPDGRTVAAGYFDGQVKLWNLPARVEVATFLAHGSTVYSVAFAPNGEALVSAGHDGTTRLWRAALPPRADLRKKLQENL